MHPMPLFYVFGHGVNLYLTAAFLAAFPALAMALYLGRERGISPVLIIDCAFIGAVAAWAGGRIYYFSFFTNLSVELVQSKGISWAVLLSGGIASVGSIICAAMSVALFLKIHPTSRGRYCEVLDIVFPVVALYHGLARLGCFFGGCCHGKPAFELP